MQKVTVFLLLITQGKTMKKLNKFPIKALILLMFAIPTLTIAMVAPFQLDISGNGFDTKKQLKLGDVGEQHNTINFDFYDNNKQRYNFDLQYKKTTQ